MQPLASRCFTFAQPGYAHLQDDDYEAPANGGESKGSLHFKPYVCTSNHPNSLYQVAHKMCPSSRLGMSDSIGSRGTGRSPRRGGPRTVDFSWPTGCARLRGSECRTPFGPRAQAARPVGATAAPAVRPRHEAAAAQGTPQPRYCRNYSRSLQLQLQSQLHRRSECSQMSLTQL